MFPGHAETMNASPWNYLYWLALFIWAPAAFLWFIDLGQVRKHSRRLMAASVVIATLCAPVEYWIVRDVLVLHRGHFLGIYCLGIPLEDYLFFLTFPFLMAPVALKLESLTHKGVPCPEN